MFLSGVRNLFHIQGCGKIVKSPEVPNHEKIYIQHLNLYEKSEFFQSPKVKS